MISGMKKGTWFLSGFSLCSNSSRQKDASSSTFPFRARISKENSTHARARVGLLLLRLLQSRPSRVWQIQSPLYSISSSVFSHLLVTLVQWKLPKSTFSITQHALPLHLLNHLLLLQTLKLHFHNKNQQTPKIKYSEKKIRKQGMQNLLELLATADKRVVADLC